MNMMTALTLQEEEICEKVKQHPVLCDKQLKGYREHDVVTNTWNSVGKDIALIENGRVYKLTLFFYVVHGVENNSTLRRIERFLLFLCENSQKWIDQGCICNPVKHLRYNFFGKKKNKAESH